ncbi:hypothetical protein [Clostridium peptidivorans]|uniref:hypothetical protein n=1 Tax=Clostridium peptidivorans TaxID=100174 RepID=UPI000BE3BC0B|nr:hypothetical protein [Clostridium peptidivorans]
MDLKDKLTSSLTKIAQSVEEGANIIAKKSSDVVEISKLNFNISNEEKSIKNKYEEIGKIIFEKYKNSEIIDKDLEEHCKELDNSLTIIKELSNKISNLKGDKEKDD